jgi:hypothetical protein
MNPKEIKTSSPLNFGWLEYKLNSKEMDYMWRCIENKKEDYKKKLAGNITGSYTLMDRGDWFYTTVLLPLITTYSERFVNLGDTVPIMGKHPYCLERWWVNYQKQNEFNPLHNHSGIYSFVIWMKIPYNSKKQNQKNIARNSNSPLIGDFKFCYTDMLGRIRTHKYCLSSEYEGTMLFFPSSLSHEVYPFYDCDEDRISVSGNIMVDVTKRL